VAVGWSAQGVASSFAAALIEGRLLEAILKAERGVASCGGSHRWSREAREVARVQKRLTTAGVVVRGSTAEAFGQHMAREFGRWNAVREAAGIPQQ
jgi:hypothetical protein